jgi:GTP1/Obg family GTP-binding protein
VVVVLGNKNKGKSFILSKIGNKTIPDGYNITTKGLSIIYPDYEEKNIIILDTAGFEV